MRNLVNFKLNLKKIKKIKKKSLSKTYVSIISRK